VRGEALDTHTLCKRFASVPKTSTVTEAMDALPIQSMFLKEV
jgi:hypothetical protein